MGLGKVQAYTIDNVVEIVGGIGQQHARFTTEQNFCIFGRTQFASAGQRRIKRAATGARGRHTNRISHTGFFTGEHQRNRTVTAHQGRFYAAVVGRAINCRRHFREGVTAVAIAVDAAQVDIETAAALTDGQGATGIHIGIAQPLNRHLMGAGKLLHKKLVIPGNRRSADGCAGITFTAESCAIGQHTFVGAL